MGLYVNENIACEMGKARKTNASDKQKNLMRNLGIEFDNGISVYRAMSKISTKIRQNKNKAKKLLKDY